MRAKRTKLKTKSLKSTTTTKTTRRGSKRPRSAQRDLPEVTLPKTKSAPLQDFSTLAVWLHGEGGTGKTTLSSQWDDVCHFMFDPGAKFISAYQRPVNSWLEWVAYLDKLEEQAQSGRLKFQTITVDTACMAFQQCWDFMLEVLDIEHPGDEEDFGRSWNAIYTEYMRQMNRAKSIPGCGCVFISHSKESLYKPEFGPKHTLVRPNLPSKLLNQIHGAMDLMGYMYYDDEDELRMQIRSGDGIMAKCRPPAQFLTPRNEMVREVPMGATHVTAYKNLLSAFLNKQQTPDGRKTAPRKKKRLRK